MEIKRSSKRIINSLLSVSLTAGILLSSFPAFVHATVKLPKSITLNYGDKYVLNTNIKKNNLKSANPKIASITVKGKIRAKKPGKTVVTAKIRGKTYKIKVRVRTLLVAHRGFSSAYPENTLEGFSAAVKNGFDGIECDVWESKNGDIMVAHDAGLKRTTRKNGFIWKVNRKNRSKFPIVRGKGIEKFKGKKLLIPSLQEVVRFVKKHKCRLMLHIKSKGSYGYKPSSKGIKKIIKIIKKYKIKTRTTIFARSKKILKLCIGNDIRLAALVTPKSKTDLLKNILWCRKKGVKNIVLLSFDDLKKKFTVKKVAKLMKSNGLKYGIYTAVTRSQYKTLLKNGADFAISDYQLRSK